MARKTARDEYIEVFIGHSLARLRCRVVLFLRVAFDVACACPSGGFAGVAAVDVADDAVEDAAGDHSALDAFANFEHFIHTSTSNA